MRVAVDGQHRAAGRGAAGQGAVQIQVVRGTVHFDGRAAAGRRLEQPIEVEVVSRVAAGRPVGGMGDHVHEGVVDRPQIAVEQAAGVVAGAVVQRGQHDIELREDVVVEVEAAVGHDFDFHAVEDVESGRVLPRRVDVRALPRDVPGPQRALRGRSLRVIGDGQVLVAQAVRGLHHLLDAVPPVAPAGVGVQIALDVLRRDERGQGIALGQVQFIGTFTQFGRHVGEPKVVVEFFLGRARHALPGAPQPAVVEDDAVGAAPRLEPGYVAGGAGVPRKCRPGRVAGGEVHLYGTALGDERDARAGPVEDRGPAAQAREGLEHLIVRIGAGHRQQRDVLDRRRVPPETAERCQLFDRRADAPKFLRDEGGQRVRATE